METIFLIFGMISLILGIIVTFDQIKDDEYAFSATIAIIMGVFLIMLSFLQFAVKVGEKRVLSGKPTIRMEVTWKQVNDKYVPADTIFYDIEK